MYLEIVVVLLQLWSSGRIERRFFGHLLGWWQFLTLQTGCVVASRLSRVFGHALTAAARTDAVGFR